MKNKILINWGSYDVDNFGDLLFPFLAEFFLGPFYSKIIYVSPTGTRSRWPDAKPTCKIKEALNNKDIEGLVIGGGNLISWTKSSSINYVEDNLLAKIVHPSFFYLPYILRVKYGIPFAFNFVGVSKPIPLEKQEIVKRAIECASFISCRDVESKDRLIKAGVSSPISVGLDSAIDICQVFPENKLTEFFHNTVKWKYDIPTGKPLAVIHIKDRYMKGHYKELSQITLLFIRQNIHPVFIPLGMCHQDELVFSNNNFQGFSATVVQSPELLFDLLSILRVAKYYIGSSLHGAIAALSYKNKAVIVADENESRIPKYSGLLKQLDIPDCLFSSWKNAYHKLSKNGLSVFKNISKDKFAHLRERRNAWLAIHDSLESTQNFQPSFLPTDAFSSLVANYFGV